MLEIKNVVKCCVWEGCMKNTGHGHIAGQKAKECITRLLCASQFPFLSLSSQHLHLTRITHIGFCSHSELGFPSATGAVNFDCEFISGSSFLSNYQLQNRLIYKFTSIGIRSHH